MDQFKKMTETPITKLLVSLSIPTIISMLVTNIYNMVDTAFVGTLGTSASGAVGVVFGFMAILQAIGFMFGQGCGSMLSRRLGAKDREGAIDVASTGFFCSFGFGVIAALLCLMFLEPLCILLGSTKTILPFAKQYVICIILAAPFVTSSFTLNNILRYEGKAILGMVGMMSGAVLNICGDAILIFGFKLGILGAGISTALSQLVSFSILLSMFFRGKTQTKLKLSRISMGYMLVNIMLTGFPSMLRQGLNSIATIILNMEAKPYGDAAISAMSIVSRVAFFVFSIALGIGQGFQPISAFNYGAKKFDRVKKAYKTTIVMGTGVVLVLSIGVYMYAPEIIYLFRNDPDVVEIGSRALILQCIALYVIPYCMTTEMLLQSTGKKLGATILSSTRSGVFFIPAIIILAHFRGIAGIQEAQPLAYVLSVFPTIAFGVSFFKNLKNDMS